MDLAEFKAKVTVLPKDEARKVRANYVRHFVSAGSEQKREFAGIWDEGHPRCYCAYLWEFLKDPVVVEFDFAVSMCAVLGPVNVLWDLHSAQRVFIKDYWKFARDDVLALDYRLLLDNLGFLPEDIYIFDESYRWTLVLTHEWVEGRRWCLKSGCLG